MGKLTIALSLLSLLATVNGFSSTTDLRSSPVTGNFSTTSPASEPRTSTTSRLLAATFPQWPDELNCDVTLEMCRQEAISNFTAWRTVCFMDRSRRPAIVRQCSSICLSTREGNQHSCEDFCPDYMARCTETTTLSASQNGSVLETTAPSQTTILWPTQLNCNATLEMCRLEATSNTTAWRTVCFLDRSQIPAIVRQCSSVCLSTYQADQYRCEDFCPDYKEMCLGMSTSTPVNTLATTTDMPTLPQPGTRWPDIIQCNVTLSMCQQKASSNTTAWRVTCFFDTSYLEPIVSLCSTICLSTNRNLLHKCEDKCTDYNEMCLRMSTSKPVSTRATTNVMPTLPQPGTLWPDAIQCDVTLNMCQQEDSSNRTAWRVTCFLDTSYLEPIVSLCSTICLSTNDNFQHKCEDKCTGYVKECINTSTTTTYVPGVLTTNASASNGLHGGIPTSNKLPWLASLLLLPVAAGVVFIYRRRRNRCLQQGPVRYVKSSRIYYVN